MPDLRWDYYGVPYEGDGRIGEVAGGSGNLFGISGSTLSDLFHPGVYNINNLTTIHLVGKNSPNPNIQPYNGAYKNFAPGHRNVLGDERAEERNRKIPVGRE